MKKIIFLLTAISILLYGCAEPGPVRTAEKFLGHLKNGEWQEMEKISTDKSKTIINVMQKLSGAETYKNKDFKIINCTITDSLAKCRYVDAAEHGSELLLVQENGEWKVELAREW